MPQLKSCGIFFDIYKLLLTQKISSGLFSIAYKHSYIIIKKTYIKQHQYLQDFID